MHQNQLFLFQVFSNFQIGKLKCEKYFITWRISSFWNAPSFLAHLSKSWRKLEMKIADFASSRVWPISTGRSSTPIDSFPLQNNFALELWHFDDNEMIPYIWSDFSLCALTLLLALAAGGAWILYLTFLARCLHDEKCSVGSSHKNVDGLFPTLTCMEILAMRCLRYQLKILVVMAHCPKILPH